MCLDIHTPTILQARTVADAFMQAHQSRQGRRGQGGRPALPLLSASASIGEESRATAGAAERVYAHLHDILMKAVNYRSVDGAVCMGRLFLLFAEERDGRRDTHGYIWKYGQPMHKYNPYIAGRGRWWPA